ncbi:MAG: PilZ domain-containing protein [Myxococcota bacterium]
MTEALAPAEAAAHGLVTSPLQKANFAAVEPTMATLFIGDPPAERSARWARDAERAGCESTHVRTERAGRATLAESVREGVIPRAVFIEQSQDVAGFVAWMRGQGALFNVPIIAVVPAAAEQRFVSAHRAGADDAIVDADDGGITRRLANLAEFDPAARPETRDACVIVGPESRRRIVGRIMRQAGFELRFAQDDDEVRRQAEGATMIIAEGVEDAAWLHSAERPSTILLVDDERLSALRGCYERCSVGDRLAPPDHLLFQTNELLRPDVSNVRASKRVLHSALCTFRPSGTLEPAYGLTYNFSREGLYVRTLDPPARGQSLWLELRPPFQRDAVHLRGEVVWATGPTRPGGTTPPGFGLRLLEEACPPCDLKVFRAGYEELVESESRALPRVA